MLYVTGGLVLGETIALWMTAEQVCVGLAAMLLVLTCVFLRSLFCANRRGRNGRRLPVFFGYFVTLWLGLVIGTLRMEYEEWIVRSEQEIIREKEGFDVKITGLVTEIQSVEHGIRLSVAECEWESDIFEEAQETDGMRNIRRMYIYTDFIDDLRLGMSVSASGTCEIPEPDRNPGGFDYRQYCLSKGIGGVFYAEQVFLIRSREGPKTVFSYIESGYWTIRETVRLARLILENQLEQIAEPEDLGILKAVLLGQKADMDESIYELYQKNGIAHILAISGLHISIVGMGAWKLLRFRFGYMVSGIIAFFVLLAYGMMTGFGPSVIRAVFMMGLSFFAGAIGRTYDLPSAMCVPAMGILLRKPYMLVQASFQLSFLAVIAMFVPGTVLAHKWEWKGTLEKLWVSCSLQIISLPFVLLHSYEVPAFGLLLNLLVVPLMSYVLISGMLGILGSFLWNGFGIVLLGGAHVILKLYYRLCRAVQQIPGSGLILGIPNGWQFLGYYCLVLGGTYLMFRYCKRWLFLWGAAFLLLVFWPRTGLTVTFLDVGQGDGIFLECGGKTMLVDCGSSQNREVGTEVLIPFLKSQGVQTLNTIVVTHGDQDHVSGIRALLENPESGIMVDQMILSERSAGDPVCLELLALAKKRKISVQYCRAGDRLTGVLGDKIDILCLNPASEGIHEQGMDSDRNGDSVVLQIAYRSFSMLLTGDIGSEEEMRLMDQYDLSSVTILKAAHHGSGYSNSKAFLEKIKPSYVVFSYGEGNSYGHPASGVVNICEELGAQVCETARSGAVRIWTDGTFLQIEGWLDRQDGI